MADPAGRFSIALDANALDWDVTWTALDQEHPNLVTSYEIDRGRQFEFDQTEGGRATVQVLDPDGILDPTNASGPYYGQLEPSLQAALARYNPITEDWHTRFRGFIEDFDYTYDPSQRLGVLTISLVDIFETLNAIEMQVGVFGVTPSAGSAYANTVYFLAQDMDERIIDVLETAGFLPDQWFVVFTGNVIVGATSYTPGESVMTAIQEAADAEFPGVSNVYPDRFGRICVHGRLAKFDPEGVEAGTTPDKWTFREFTVGDGAAVNAAPSITAQIRRFAFNRGKSKVINQAIATPQRLNGPALTAAERAAQLVTDATSQDQYGLRPWSAEGLITHIGEIGSTNDLVETRRFAQFMVDNYKIPRNRISDIAVRTVLPERIGAAATWNLLCRLDIADTVTVNVGGAGGGGFEDETFFVEGVHEESRPLNPVYDDVTMSMDLSPRAYFAGSDPWSP